MTVQGKDKSLAQSNLAVKKWAEHVFKEATKNSLWEKFGVPQDLAGSIDWWYGRQRTDIISNRWFGERYDEILIKQLKETKWEK